MAIKATFNTDETSITLQALHQWDYGQEIEIEADDIPESIIQVHFANAGMTEAIVHSCTFASGKGVVPIPNQCLEKTSPITAWIYEIEKGSDGFVRCRTTKTITIPIVERTRPSNAENVPQVAVDTASELIAEVNKLKDKANEGKIIAKHALTSNEAGHAETTDYNQYVDFADYASEDTTKGTIEERLTELGF